MSTDTVVIAAYIHPGCSELAYTAAVVQAAAILFDYEYGLGPARSCFIDTPRVWFTGTGGLSRAKQFANLLAEETRANGTLGNERWPILEIGEDGVHTLSRKGKRKTPPVYMSAPEYGWVES